MRIETFLQSITTLTTTRRRRRTRTTTTTATATTFKLIDCDARSENIVRSAAQWFMIIKHVKQRKRNCLAGRHAGTQSKNASPTVVSTWTAKNVLVLSAGSIAKMENILSHKIFCTYVHNENLYWKTNQLFMTILHLSSIKFIIYIPVHCRYLAKNIIYFFPYVKWNCC